MTSTFCWALFTMRSQTCTPQCVYTQLSKSDNQKRHSQHAWSVARSSIHVRKLWVWVWFKCANKRKETIKERERLATSMHYPKVITTSLVECPKTKIKPKKRTERTRNEKRNQTCNKLQTHTYLRELQVKGSHRTPDNIAKKTNSMSFFVCTFIANAHIRTWWLLLLLLLELSLVLFFWANKCSNACRSEGVSFCVEKMHFS